MRTPRILLPALILLGFAIPVLAQNLPYRGAAMERMIVVLPMGGAGTPENPRRPMGLSLLQHDPAAPVAYHYILSDDGHFAIVELTAANAKHFDPALKVLSGMLHRFSSRKDSRVSVERVLKLLRKDFDLETFVTGGALQGVRQ